jgi:hypothetical protein
MTADAVRSSSAALSAASLTASYARRLGTKTDILGKIELVYAPPPNGIIAAEWRTAVDKDRALQRAIASASR